MRPLPDNFIGVLVKKQTNHPQCCGLIFGPTLGSRFPFCKSRRFSQPTSGGVFGCERSVVQRSRNRRTAISSLAPSVYSWISGADESHRLDTPNLNFYLQRQQLAVSKAKVSSRCCVRFETLPVEVGLALMSRKVLCPETPFGGRRQQQ